jgi:hypothetical protein
VDGRSAPPIPLTPVVSSVDVMWQGFLLEQHASHPGFAIDTPEHYSAKHLLHLNTGGPSSIDWRLDGKNLMHNRPDAHSVFCLPAFLRWYD